MDKKTQQKLIDLTSQFYATVADSFSDTRQNAWDGWQKVTECVELTSSFSLLDVACGNLRFEKFLTQKNLSPKVAYCVDNCEPLLPEELPSFVQFKKANLFSEKLEFEVDFAVCFGFMHHIPTFERRKNFLVMLMNNVKAGGHVAVSFWQFMKDERIAKKAVETTRFQNIVLDEGDFLLGWKQRTDVFRYCHNFSDDEIAALTAGLQVVAQFSEDGKAHNLNKYVILKKL